MRTINALALPLLAVAGLALAADTWAQGRPGGGSGYRGGGSPGASGGRWQGGGRGAAPSGRWQGGGTAVAPGRWSGGGYRGSNTGYRGSGYAGGGYRGGYSGNGHGRYYGGHSHYGHRHYYGSAYWGWWGAAIAAPFLWAGYYGPWPYWSYTGYYGPYYSSYYGPGYGGYPWVADAGYSAPSAAEPVPTTEVPPLGAGAPTERPLYLNYCAEAQAYFPKVTTCAGGWQVRRPQY
jgi:hypothetical protein